MSEVPSHAVHTTAAQLPVWSPMSVCVAPQTGCVCVLSAATVMLITHSNIHRSSIDTHSFFRIFIFVHSFFDVFLSGLDRKETLTYNILYIVHP